MLPSHKDPRKVNPPCVYREGVIDLQQCLTCSIPTTRKIFKCSLLGKCSIVEPAPVGGGAICNGCTHRKIP